MKLLTTVGLAFGARAVAADGIAFAGVEEAGDKEVVRLDRRDEAVPYGVNALEGDAWNKRKRDHDSDSDSDDGDDRDHRRRHERDNDRYGSKDYMFGYNSYGDGDDYNRQRGVNNNRFLPEYRPDRYNARYVPPSPWNKVRQTDLNGIDGAEVLPTNERGSSAENSGKLLSGPQTPQKQLQQLGMRPGSSMHGNMMRGNMMGGGSNMMSGGGLRGGMHQHHSGPGMYAGPGGGRHFMSAEGAPAELSHNNLRSHEPAQRDRKFTHFSPMESMYMNGGSLYPESFPPMMDGPMPGLNYPGMMMGGGPMPGMMMGGGPMPGMMMGMPPPPFMPGSNLGPGIMSEEFIESGGDLFGEHEAMHPGHYRRGFAEQRAAKPY